ncbi:hypothetical protein ACGRHY_19650 [Streptomyces sp. HK10]|uniref:hypothetical protein n=1 Tax=Streptomyces sp. HK10 TaxID=3373255 RepID=UPI0037499CCD
MSRVRTASRGRAVRWGALAVVPAEVALVVCLLAGVRVPWPVLAVAEAAVAGVLVAGAAVLVRAWRAARRRGLGGRAAAGEAVRAAAAAVPVPVRRLLAHEARGVASLVRWAARRPHGVGAGDTPVPYAGGQAALVYGLLFATVVETAVLAVLLAGWPVAHTVVLVLNVWSVLLVLGFHAACAVRPHVVGADGSLRVRYGALVDVAVPAGSVTAVRVEHRFPSGRPVEVAGGLLDLSVGGRTTVTVELEAPVEVVRPLGGRERARVLRLYADDPRAAVAALRAGAGTGTGLR